MVYMDGDVGAYQPVEVQAIYHLIEIESASHNDKLVKNIVMVDRTSPWPGVTNSNTRIYDISTSNRVLKKDMGELNMGDPKTLSDFILWTMKYYPASNYALVLMNHGNAWKGACQDNTSGEDMLTLPDLSTALATVSSSTMKTIGLIGFDACLMSYVEVAFQIRQYAKVMVASEESQWCVADGTGGWPYKSIVSTLTINAATMTVEGLGSTIVGAYATFWSQNPPPGGFPPIETMAAIRLAYVEDLVYMGIDILSASLRAFATSYRSAIQTCRASVETFNPLAGRPSLIDLGHFVDLVSSCGIPMGRAALTSINTINNNLNWMMITSWHHPSGHPNFHGLGIYFPTVAQQLAADTDYSTIAFTGDPFGAPNWYGFLKAYHGIS